MSEGRVPQRAGSDASSAALANPQPIIACTCCGLWLEPMYPT